MADGLVELSGALRAGDAAGLRDRLGAALDAGDLRVTTTDVTEADCATVQVLVAAQRTAAHLDRKLQIDIPEGGALAVMLDRLALRAALAG
jgi:anti-anti-sigma regulatory factor